MKKKGKNIEKFLIEFKRSKKGWIKIVEAVTVILLLAGMLIIIVSSEGVRGFDVAERAYNVQVLILREIQLNKSLRNEILDSNGRVNYRSGELFDVDNGFPDSIRDKILEREPNWLKCSASICPIGVSCMLTEEQEQDVTGDNVYVQSIMITIGEDPPNQDPKVISLFCWD